MTPQARRIQHKVFLKLVVVELPCTTAVHALVGNELFGLWIGDLR